MRQNILAMSISAALYGCSLAVWKYIRSGLPSVIDSFEVRQ